MPTIISIDYVPGVCDTIISNFQRDGFVVLPTHTDIIKHRDIHASISACIHNVMSRLQHIKRCLDTQDAIVCTHWYSVPICILGTKDLEDVIVRYMHRHTRDLIRAFGVTYNHIPIVLRVHRDECLERIITGMDGDEIGIHHIDTYTAHLDKVPTAYHIELPLNGMDIPYICDRVVEAVEKIRTEHGL